MLNSHSLFGSPNVIPNGVIVPLGVVARWWRQTAEESIHIRDHLKIKLYPNNYFKRSLITF
jgi:hypothetical protein